MTRPQIIRADSIDLQDPDTPSAQDHRHDSSTDPTSSGKLLAPHQAETLREVAAETKEERRISWNGGIGDLQQFAEDLNGTDSRMQQQDALAIAQNGGNSGNVDEDDADMVDDGDVDLDDDMDRISSSPSIEDGGYTPDMPPVWPARSDSLRVHLSSSESQALSEARSSSPYLESPEYLPLPLKVTKRQSSKASAQTLDSHHPSGEYDETGQDDKPGERATDGIFDNDRCTGSAESSTAPRKDPAVDTDVIEPAVNGRSSSVDLNIEDWTWEFCSTRDSLDLSIDEADAMISPYDFLIPYDASDEDDDDDILFTDDSRCIDSGWGGECLQDLEDIDFDFVYALHTFVATVEGQANATKGDTMVLLDDSNSYWWLVRVVKDSSIGYLPAEHIETPTERLARLNKHRNIDLAATMLGDQAEKSKNPIKSAIKRRKAKTVTFSAPTYVDYSDIEYSSDEEDAEGEIVSQQLAAQEQQAQQQQQSSQQQVAAQSAVIEDADDESAKVEPLKPKTQKQVRIEPVEAEERHEDTETAGGTTSKSDEMLRPDSQVRTTKNGTVRNTDSFFKDDTVETKKITLTPNLLRDDDEPRPSTDSANLRSRASFDKLERDLAPDKSKDKKKDKDKKEKEKKPGGIRGFFSRKDKKKSGDEDDDSLGKRSMDGAEDETQPADGEAAERGPTRSPSKLQKQQPRIEARIEPTLSRRSNSVGAQQSSTADLAAFLRSDKPNNVSNTPPASLRMVNPEDDGTSLGSTKFGKPQKVSKAKSRLELDDFDSSEDEETADQPARPSSAPAGEPATRQISEEKQSRPTLPGSFPDSYQSVPTPQSAEFVDETQTEPTEPAPESPVQVSPSTSSNPPALVGDNSSQDDHSSPTSSPSPELVDAERRGHQNQDSVTTNSTTATTTTASTWNDANLRAFFDSGSEIRDLLVVVYDKSDVPPVAPDTAISSTLFREQNAKLAEITTQLDNMLGDWLARKQRMRNTV